MHLIFVAFKKFMVQIRIVVKVLRSLVYGFYIRSNR